MADDESERFVSISDEWKARSIAELLEASVKREVTVILRLIQTDPHQWSKRPCQTCEAVSVLASQPFGCNEERNKK